MKARVAIGICAGLVVVAAVLTAQTPALLDPGFEAKLRALSPDDSQGLFNLGVSAFLDSQYDETKLIADKLLALDKEDPRAIYLKSAAEYHEKAGMVDVGVVPPVQEDRPDRRVGPVAAVLTDEEVDTIMEKYGAKFRTIQNTVLLRRCATRECHGNSDKSGAFYLKTARTAEPRTIAENFRAVERYVNVADKADSTVLKKALAEPPEHPGGPVFRTERDPMYQRLKAWVDELPGLWD